MKNYFTIILALLSASYAQSQSQYVGTALEFDGNDDYVNIDNIVSDLKVMDAFTVEAVINPSQIQSQAYAVIFAINSTDGSNELNRLVLRLSGGNESPVNTIVLNIPLANQGNTIIGTKNVLDDNCHHVALTYGNNISKLYIDGVYQGEINFHLNFEADDKASLGQEYDKPNFTTSQHYKGQMDNVRLWNYALTSQEITDNIYNEIPNSTQGLVANFLMNDGVPFGNNLGISTIANSINPNKNGYLKNFARTGNTSNFTQIRCTIKSADVKDLDNNSIYLFPNPASDFITISGVDFANDFSIIIYDFTGKVILSKNNLKNNDIINLEHFAQGIYTIKIQASGIVMNDKFVKL